jgi:endonuclease I
VASGLALEAEVVVAASELVASLLMSDQFPELPRTASRTSAQWSSGVAVANAVAELAPLGVPAALAEHASHLCACSQTSVETTHISDLTLQSFSIRKDIQKSSQH